MCVLRTLLVDSSKVQLNAVSLLLRVHVLQQVHNTVGVAPLVVVPRDDLEEPLLPGEVVLQSGLAVVDRRPLVVDEVRAHQLLIGVPQDALQVGLAGLLHHPVDLLDRGVLGQRHGQINHGNIRGGHTEGHPGQLALHHGQHLTHGLGGTRGGGNDVDRCGTATSPVLLARPVDGLLGRSVGVDGGHQALLDAQALLQQHVHHGGKAVGGAGRVGDNVVGLGVVLLVVHTHHNGLHVALPRGRDHHLLGASLQVALRSGGVREQPRGLHHDVHAVLRPRQVSGVPGGHHAVNLVAVHHHHVSLSLLSLRLLRGNGVLELPVDGVVLHLVDEVLRIGGDIHHSNNVHLLAQKPLVADGLEHHAPNAAKSVDSNLHHCCGRCGERSERRGTKK
eukprot:RCo024528